jgi:hypothetical protein
VAIPSQLCDHHVEFSVVFAPDSPHAWLAGTDHGVLNAAVLLPTMAARPESM